MNDLFVAREDADEIKSLAYEVSQASEAIDPEAEYLFDHIAEALDCVSEGMENYTSARNEIEDALAYLSDIESDVNRLYEAALDIEAAIARARDRLDRAQYTIKNKED